MIATINAVLLLYIVPVLIGYLAARIIIKYQEKMILGSAGSNIFILFLLFCPVVNMVTCITFTMIAMFVYPYKGLSNTKMKKIFRVKE